MPTTTLRPALAALAAAPRSTTVRKLWKALTAEERAAAITASLADDENGWVKTTTRAAVAGALKFRPQTVGDLAAPEAGERGGAAPAGRRPAAQRLPRRPAPRRPPPDDGGVPRLGRREARERANRHGGQRAGRGRAGPVQSRRRRSRPVVPDRRGRDLLPHRAPSGLRELEAGGRSGSSQSARR